MNKFPEEKNFEGSVKEMVSLSLPIVVSNACYTALTFTDRLFLSKLAPEEMNAAMGGGITSFLMLTFFFGLVGYSTALVAQYYGAERYRKCPLVITQALLISLFAYPVILAMRPLGFAFFEFMKIKEPQLHHQKAYFGILIYGSVIPLLRTAFSGFFSGIGKTSVVMKSSFLVLAVNVLVNYALIFGKMGMPALGIRGAAIGTIIGGICGIAVFLAEYFKGEVKEKYETARSFSYNRKEMSKFFRFGYPAGLEILLNMLAFTLLVMLFHSRGPAAATATTILFNWDMLSFIPLLGIGIGVTSLVGKYMGAGKVSIAEKSVRSGLKLALAYSVIVAFAFLFFAGELTDVFAPGAANEIFSAARPMAVFMIQAAALYAATDAVTIVFMGALRGAGDTFGAMKLSVMMHWALVPVLYYMLKISGSSPEKSWSAAVAAFMFFSLFIYVRYRKGEWKKIRLAESPDSKIDFFPEETKEYSDL